MIVWLNQEDKIKNVVFITGSSGFVGFHLAQIFLSYQWKVIGLDAMTQYYDVELKKDRLNQLLKNSNFHSYEGFLQDHKLLDKICIKYKGLFFYSDS